MPKNSCKFDSFNKMKWCGEVFAYNLEHSYSNSKAKQNLHLQCANIFDRDLEPCEKNANLTTFLQTERYWFENWKKIPFRIYVDAEKKTWRAIIFTFILFFIQKKWCIVFVTWIVECKNCEKKYVSCFLLFDWYEMDGRRSIPAIRMENVKKNRFSFSSIYLGVGINYQL